VARDVRRVLPDDLRAAMRPVFLDPRDDYWEIHDPEDLTVDEQREYRLAPRGTADQLKNAFYCEDCFPRASAEETGRRGR